MMTGGAPGVASLIGTSFGSPTGGSGNGNFKGSGLVTPGTGSPGVDPIGGVLRGFGLGGGGGLKKSSMVGPMMSRASWDSGGAGDCEVSPAPLTLVTRPAWLTV